MVFSDVARCGMKEFLMAIISLEREVSEAASIYRIYLVIGESYLIVCGYFGSHIYKVSFLLG